MHTWMIHGFQATVWYQFQSAVRLLSYNMTADDGSIKVNIYILCLTDKPNMLEVHVHMWSSGCDTM